MKNNWTKLDDKPTAIRLTRALRCFLTENGAEMGTTNKSIIIRRIIYQSPEFKTWSAKQPKR